jgi:hypothetical protein
MKINIDINDNHAFCDVAYLVDQDNFLKDVDKLRLRFNLSNRDFPKKGSSKWKKNLPEEFTIKEVQMAEKELEEVEHKMINMNEVYEMSIEERELGLEKMKECLRKTDKIENFNIAIEDLRIGYRRPQYFDRIIEAAIVYGIVNDTDYTSYKAELVYPEMEYPQFFQQPRVVLTIYPHTRDEDIFRAKAEAEELFSKLRDMEVFPKRYFPRTKRKIRAHRDMYWLRKNNPDVSYNKLLGKWHELCTADHTKEEEKKCQYCSVKDYRSLEKNIDDYKVWLATSN